MFNKPSMGEKIFSVINYSFLTVFMISTIYPVIYVLFSSLSNANLLMTHEGLLLRPLGFELSAYRMVFRNPMVIRGYMNTIIIVVGGLCINLLLTSLGAYFLSRKNVMWKRAIMMLIIFTMFFSGGLIPSYLLVRQLGLDNSYWALLLPGAISTYNMIIMRTSFMAIPDSLEESAKLDGASHFTILFRIVLPLSQAVIAVMILYYGVAHWNSWFGAMIYLRDRKLFPLQLILREILIQNTTSDMMMDVGSAEQQKIGETIKYALIVIATLPILILYPFLQKYFVKGVMIGALKG